MYTISKIAEALLYVYMLMFTGTYPGSIFQQLTDIGAQKNITKNSSCSKNQYIVFMLKLVIQDKQINYVLYNNISFLKTIC